MKRKILSIGTMYLDINCPDFPFGEGLVPEQEIVGDKYDLAPGGSALNFARICSSMELPAVFVGKAGRDEIGKLLSELVKKTGVVPAFIESSSVSTNLGFNFIDKSGRTLLAVAGSANQSLNEKEVEKKVSEYIQEIEYLYLGGCYKLKTLLKYYKNLARRAKKFGVKIILDHGRVTNKVSENDKNTIRELLPFVDFYLPSYAEFLATWQEKNIKDAVKKIQRVSRAQIAVKDSKNGVFGFSRGKFLHLPAFKAKIIHTIGAGDSFNAGFIKAQDIGMDFRKSLRYASATATLKISRRNLPRPKDVSVFLEKF